MLTVSSRFPALPLTRLMPASEHTPRWKAAWRLQPAPALIGALVSVMKKLEPVLSTLMPLASPLPAATSTIAPLISAVVANAAAGSSSAAAIAPTTPSPIRLERFLRPFREVIGPPQAALGYADPTPIRGLGARSTSAPARARRPTRRGR